MLRDEELTHAPKAKKCSFTTSRPALWAKIIENHLREVVNPYFSSKYKSYDSQYLEYTLYFNGDEDKKVTINIYVKTGVILVQGEHYLHWAEKVFPVLKEQVACQAARDYRKFEAERSERKRASSVYSSSSNGFAAKARSKSVGNLSLLDDSDPVNDTEVVVELNRRTSDVKSTSGCGGVLNDIGGMGYLYQENVALKVALQELEKDYKTLTGELENVQLKSKSQGTAIDKVYAKVTLEEVETSPQEEEAVEEVEVVEASEEVEAAVTTEETDCEGHIEARSKLITDSAWKLESQISEMRDRLQGKITDIRHTLGGGGTPPFCRCHVWNDLAKIQSHIASVQQLILGDIDELKSRVGKIETGFESLTAKILPTHTEGLKRLEGEHEIVAASVEEMKNGLDEMRKKMLVAWGDNDAFQCVKCATTVVACE